MQNAFLRRAPSAPTSGCWPFGRLAVWPFGRLAVWPFGRLAVWPFGRLAVWPFGRLAVVFGVVLVSSTFASQQARAGTWEMVFQQSKSNPDGIPLSEMVSGSNTLNGLSRDWKVRVPTDWMFGSNITYSGTQQGTVTKWLRFVPDPNAVVVPNATELPPASVAVLVSVTGDASAKDQLGPDAGYTKSVRVSVAGLSGSGPALKVDSGGNAGLSTTLKGSLLLKLVPTKRADGKYYVSFPVVVGNSASVAGPRTKPDGSPLVGGEVTCSFTASMVKDSRSVAISRGLTAKKWNDTTLDEARDEWVEADGTGHGHTIYSYTEAVAGRGATTMQHWNVQNFTANFAPFLGLSHPPGWDVIGYDSY